MGLRDWASGTSEVEEVKNTVASSFTKSVNLSVPKPSSLYPSLKVFPDVSTSKVGNNASLKEEEGWITIPTRMTPVKKVEPMESEKISISRLGWNRDQELSSVRKFRCRTDTNLKAAAFLSK